MEPEGSLPQSQVPTTFPYPVRARSIPSPQILIPEDPSWYYPPIYDWVFQVVSFPQVSLPKPLLSPHVLHTPPILIFFIWHPINIWWGVQIIKLHNM